MPNDKDEDEKLPPRRKSIKAVIKGSQKIVKSTAKDLRDLTSSFPSILHTTGRISISSLGHLLKTSDPYELKLQQETDKVIAQRLATIMRDLIDLQDQVIVLVPWIENVIEESKSESNKKFGLTIQNDIEAKNPHVSLEEFFRKYVEKSDDSTKKLVAYYLNEMRADIAKEQKHLNPADLENVTKIERNIDNLLEFIDAQIKNSASEAGEQWNSVKAKIIHAKRDLNYEAILKILESKDMESISKHLRRQIGSSSDDLMTAMTALADQFKIDLLIQPLAKLTEHNRHFDIYLIPIAALLINSQATPESKIDLTSAANSLRKPGLN